MHQRKRQLWKTWIIGSLAWVLGWAMLFHAFHVLGEPFRSVVSLVAFVPPVLILFVACTWGALVRTFQRSDPR
jgi:hypothetical protein